MKPNSPYALGLAVLLSVLIAIPPDTLAQTAGQRAGEVSRVIPAVSIVRGAKSIAAVTKTPVDWQDTVNTQANARARIALDDGSVLNVGSDSSLKVVKHDAGAQQTDLELAYGKLRTQAQKIAKPDGKFEVHTPAGVAGVVGTDFYMAYDNTTNTMSVIVFEGLVKVCNLAGVCVIVKAGQMTNVRSGDNSGPLQPTQATLDELVVANKESDPSGQLGTTGTAGGMTAGHAALLGILIAVPVGVVAGFAIKGNGPRPVAVVGKGGCNPNIPTTCG
jgi:hypothetical protein